MAIATSAIGGGPYGTGMNDDRENGNGFEFTRRKRWPHLLMQELVGSALFCLKPTPSQRNGVDSTSSHAGPSWAWKMLFVSPSVGEMLGQKASDLEGRDFLDLVFAPDQPQLQTLFTSLITPHAILVHQPHSSSTITSSSSDPSSPVIPRGSGRSHTTFARVLAADGQQGTEKGPVVWELRAHATGLDGTANGGGSFGMGGAGTMVPHGSSDGGEMKGRAVWVMGRRIGEGGNENEGNGNSLDSFLELKLENERLREELRELQADMDEDYEPPSATRSYVDPSPSRPAPTYHPDLSSDDPDSSSASCSSRSSSPRPYPFPSSTSKPDLTRPLKMAKPGRPPKDKDAGAREKKRVKKPSVPGPNGAGEGEGSHVCVTCGRTDSPEWRKGPLGPKTLCNACGLRWAKRNSTQPSRKERKAAVEKKG